ncbi:MAG TPA: hypothetical protein PLU17_07040, partial [Chitinophagaceae bacterium]|nr:hypothetical protein [Chitinophagaceae bacterium]
ILLANTNGTIVGAEMTNTLSNAPLYIGGSLLGTLPHFGGDIAELIVYNKILTAAERTQIYNYLNNKYNGNNLSTQFTTSTIYNTFSDEITDDKEWRHSFNSSQPNQVLTSVRSDCLTFDDRVDSVFVEANAIPYGGNYFMRRHFVINPSTEYTGTKRVRLYYSLADFNNLQNYVSSLTTHTQLSVIQYDGPNEDGLYDPTGGNISFISPSQITNGTAYGLYYLEFDITHFSEFWIQVGSIPLPVTDLHLSVVSDDNQHRLMWKCMGCSDINFFTVLESNDAQTFINKQIVPAYSNSSAYQTIIPASVLPKQFFAIETTDIDGHIYRSNICAASNKNLFNQLQVNFSSQNIIVSSTITNAKICVYNMQGQLVVNGKNSIIMSKDYFAPGLYFANLEELNAEHRSVKFAIY